jgi:hypothetical protein
MCKCEACNVRLSVMIRTVKEIWLLKSRCWLRKKIETILSHILIITWWRGSVDSAAASNCQTEWQQTQTSHRLCCNRHWRTDCNCIVSEPTEWRRHSVTVLKWSSPTTSASLRQTDSDRSWCQTMSHWLHSSLSHSHHLTTQTSRRSPTVSHFFFAHPPLRWSIDVRVFVVGRRRRCHGWMTRRIALCFVWTTAAYQS